MDNENSTGLRYDAFISYRHLEPDSYAAELLHKKLESFKLPKSVLKKHPDLPKKINRVFRDQEELPLAADLAQPITNALRNSDNLIVICTPKLKESKWCLKEIETFINFHGRDHIFTVLVEGEPEESFPDILLHDENGNDVEPLAADFRGADHKEIKKKVDKEVLRLIAPMYGLNYDDLKQRHREQRLHKIIAAGGVLLALTTAIGIYFAFTAYHIRQQANTIEAQKEKIQKQAIDIEKKYQTTLSGISETLMSDGRRKDAVSILLSVMPDSKDATNMPYNANTEYALTRALQVYSVGNKYIPIQNYENDKEIIYFELFPDNTKLMGVDADSIKIWDVDSGEIIDVIHILDRPSQVLAYVLSNEKIVYSDFDNIYLYDVLNKQSYEIDNRGLLYEHCFSESRDYFATEIDDGICIIDVTGNNAVVNIGSSVNGITYQISDFCFSEDGKQFLAIYEKRDYSSAYLMVYDVNSGNNTAMIELSPDSIYTGMCVDGNRVMISAVLMGRELQETGFIAVIDYKTETVLSSNVMADIGFYNMDYCGEYLFGTSGNRVVTAFENSDEFTLLDLITLDGEIIDCADTEYDTIKQLITDTGSVYYFNVTTGRYEKSFDYEFPNTRSVNDALSVYEGLFINLESSTYITKYNCYMNRYLETVGKSDSEYITSVDGLWAISAHSSATDNVYSCVDISSGEVIYDIESPYNQIKLINGGQDGIVLYDDCNYAVFNSEDGTLIKEVNVDSYFDFSQSGEAIYYTDENGVFRVIDTRTGNMLDYNIEENIDIDISYDNNMLASSDSESVKLYMAGSSKAVASWKVKTDTVRRLFFSSDNKYLCVMYKDLRIEIIDVYNYGIVKTLYNCDSNADRMYYIPDADDYILLGENGELLNSDFDRLASFETCIGYDINNGMLVFRLDDEIMRSEIISYDNLIELAKKVVEGYEMPSWISSRYSIVEN